MTDKKPARRRSIPKKDARPQTVPVPLEALVLVTGRANREMARTEEEIVALDLVNKRLSIYSRVYR